MGRVTGKVDTAERWRGDDMRVTWVIVLGTVPGTVHPDGNVDRVDLTPEGPRSLVILG